MKSEVLVLGSDPSRECAANAYGAFGETEIRSVDRMEGHWDQPALDHRKVFSKQT